MFFAQLKSELAKLFGKKRTYIGFGAFILVQTVILSIFKYTHHWQNTVGRLLDLNGFVASDYLSALTIAFFMLFPQIGLLMPLYVTLVGGDLVAKEAEDGTLRMILSRPVSRIRLLLVKWIAGVIFTAALVVMLGFVALAFARLYFPWTGMFAFTPDNQDSGFSLFTANQGLALYAFSHLFMVVNSITMLSVAFMFSCFNMKPASATILALSYLFINMVMQHIPFFEDYQNWFITYHLASWCWVYQQPISWPMIFQSETVLLATSATALVIGVLAFQVRDIKS